MSLSSEVVEEPPANFLEERGDPEEYIPRLFREDGDDEGNTTPSPPETLSYYHESPHRASKQFGRVIYEDPRVDSEGTVKARLQSDATLPREAVT